MTITPPRHGEGDRPAQPGGGGVFSASSDAFALALSERRSGNLPEVIMWRVLRLRPGGFKFRRQHPIGQFSLDFACLSARLAIEIDGEAHSRGDRPERDMARDDALKKLGFRTMRVPAREVLGNLDGVVAGIVAACQAGQPLHQPSAGPPPRTGAVLYSHLPGTGRWTARRSRVVEGPPGKGDDPRR